MFPGDPMMVAVCLLWLVEDLAPTRAQRTLLSLLLFYARKALILYLKKKSMAPSLPYWKGLVNKMIPLYNATYLSRGCKFGCIAQLLSYPDEN